jgi:hypothetical protein
MSVKHAKIFHPKAFKYASKLAFFGAQINQPSGNPGAAAFFPIAVTGFVSANPPVEIILSDTRKRNLRLAVTRKPGLPDLSRHNIPKRGKIYPVTTTGTNGHKLYQMTV